MLWENFLGHEKKQWYLNYPDVTLHSGYFLKSKER